MALDEMTERLGTSTTRRTVVKTGAKIAYAAPIVAASFKLTSMTAAAQAVSGSCTNVIGACNVPANGCNGDASCACFRTIDGSSACIQFNVCCAGCKTCSSNADCGSGCACVADTCLGNVCQPLCGVGASGEDAGPNLS